jgi:hypothetical protein
MLTSWANHAAIVAFGLSVGVLVRVQVLLTPAAFEAALHRPSGPDEHGLESLEKRTREQSDIMAEARKRSPALRRVGNAVLAVIAVLILTIVLSPVEMEWLWLIGSVGAGALAAEVLVRLARAGRVNVLTREAQAPQIADRSAPDGS